MMHIGRHIQKVLKDKGYTVVWFAKELSCHRTTIYKAFEKSSIDTQDLMRVSRVLNYDFFSDLSKEFSESMKNTPPPSVVNMEKCSNIGDAK